MVVGKQATGKRACILKAYHPNKAWACPSRTTQTSPTGCLILDPDDPPVWIVWERGLWDRGRTPLRHHVIFTGSEKQKSHTRACTNDNPENPVRHSCTLALPPPSVRARLASILISGWKTGQARRDHQHHGQKPHREGKFACHVRTSSH
jgi:hypothetical protein